MNPSNVVCAIEAVLDGIVHYVEYHPVSAGLALVERAVGRRKRLPHNWRKL
jgi:hypothetical protein